MTGAATAVGEAVAALYGADAARSLARRRGVLHVVSTCRWEGALHVLRIGPAAPASETDGFALGLARARVDAILTSGQILRDEPKLSHRIAPALRAWRKEVLGRSDPARIAILTRGGDIDFGHPVFAGQAAPPVIVTGVDAAENLRSRRPAGVRVVGREQPGLLDAVGWLQETGSETLLIETGPGVSRALYEASPGNAGPAELLLSIYLGPLGRDQIGGRLASEEAVVEILGEPVHEERREEAGGGWLFRRYRRGGG